MILRLSQQLARKVKVPHLSQLPAAEDPLTDWSAHVFNVSRTQYILISNTYSLYSTVMFSRGMKDTHELIVGALVAIRDTMEEDGLLSAYMQRIVPASGVVQFGKAFSRSVTGSVNELIATATLFMADDDLSPYDAGQRLNDILLSILAGPDGKPYGKPREAMRELIDNRH